PATLERRRCDDPHHQPVQRWFREPLAVGFAMPATLESALDGILLLAEGDSTCPTRPGMLPRILALDPSGHLRVSVTEDFAGPRGLAVHDGVLYASAKGTTSRRL
ncbi:MAG: hypothetical protein AB1511_02850, partial [Deinococcota bacterium]